MSTDPARTSSQGGCPTIVETTSTCSTCVQHECLTIDFVTVPTSCPLPPAVRSTAVGCDQPCPTGCASTYHYWVTLPSSTAIPPTASTSSSPSSQITGAPSVIAPLGTACKITVTSTFNPGTAGGCDIECSQEYPCYADGMFLLLSCWDRLTNCSCAAAIILPCGCTTATYITTLTKTACATRTPCIKCDTNWGLFTVTQTCPPVSRVG